MKKWTACLVLFAALACYREAEGSSFSWQVAISATSITLAPGDSYTLTVTLTNTGSTPMTFPSLTWAGGTSPLVASGPGLIFAPIIGLSGPTNQATFTGWFPNVLGYASDPFGTTLNLGDSLTISLVTVSGGGSLSSIVGPPKLFFSPMFLMDALTESGLITPGYIEIPIVAGTQTAIGSALTFDSCAYQPKTTDGLSPYSATAASCIGTVSNAVPEPATGALVLPVVCLMIGYFRRKPA